MRIMDKGKTRIVTVFTGGTIGSRAGASGDISPDRKMAYRLLKMYQDVFQTTEVENSLADIYTSETDNSSTEFCVLEKDNGITGFLTEEPYYILSENLTGKELLLLARCVEKYLHPKMQDSSRRFCKPMGKEAEGMSSKEEKGIDGIIILHGTDTLQYTAAFLSYVFADANVPIVLVSSAKPLEKIDIKETGKGAGEFAGSVCEKGKANGFQNFCGAVEFIRGGFCTGVYVSYANEGECVKIHSGERLIRSKEYSADVLSSFGSVYGSFDEGGAFLRNPSFQEKKDVCFDFFPRSFKEQQADLAAAEIETEIYLTETCRGVLRISPYVGMTYPVLTGEIKVVLMESYHSGTLGITRELKEFAKEAALLKIPVYLTGLDEESADYETVREYEELGIIPLRNKSGV